MKVDPEFRVFYEREFPKVFRAAVLLSRDRETAEDATQEAFARALARWRRLADEPWAPGWVVTTALNVVRRASRKAPFAGAQTPLDVPDAESSMDLRAAIAALPPGQLEAIALHYLMDMSVAETAAAMQVNEGTVKAHLARARVALGRELRIEAGDPPPEAEVAGPEETIWTDSDPIRSNDA